MSELVHSSLLRIIMTLNSSAGAVADLFDLSCLSKKDKSFENIQDSAYEAWTAAPGNSLVELGKKYKKLGAHFFIKNNNGGISPVWDFRGDAAPDQPDAFVLAARVAGLKAPTGSQDVDWLQLKGVSGGLAASVYRTHTKGGPPPASVSTLFFLRFNFCSRYHLILSARLVLVTSRSNMCPSTGSTAAQSPSLENQALTIWTVV